MRHNTIRVGIISKEAYKQRTIAIAKGEYKPNKTDPKIWFESLLSMAQILSNENRELLRIIQESKPKSLGELEELSGRKKSNLSRTLKTLENYGIVELKKERNRLMPIVNATNFEVTVSVA